MTEGGSAGAPKTPREPLQQLQVLQGSHEGAVLAVRFNADGRYCLSCGKDRTIRLWNPLTGLHVSSYNAHAREVRDVAVSSDNARLASCGAERTILLWDVVSGRVIRRFRGHEPEVNSVRFNHTDAALVSGGYDRSVKVWDCRSNSMDAMQVMDPFDDAVMSVAVTADEIVASSVDGSICTFDIRMGRLTLDEMGRECPVNCVRVSNDSNCLLASCLLSTCRLLDRATGEVLNDYKGHENERYKVEACFSRDDAWVLSGSEDGRLVVWDLVEATILGQPRVHKGPVTGLSVHPREPMLLSCSTDGTCILWRMALSDPD